MVMSTVEKKIKYKADLGLKVKHQGSVVNELLLLKCCAQIVISFESIICKSYETIGMSATERPNEPLNIPVILKTVDQCHQQV